MYTSIIIVYVYIYIYMYTPINRERDVYTYVIIYIYIYIYILSHSSDVVAPMQRSSWQLLFDTVTAITLTLIGLLLINSTTILNVYYYY